jgi:4-diphosphocytidyl-2-C-methyl-D-erythritol kinase
MVYQVKLSLIKQLNSWQVKLLCPAKVNLYLNILGKYKDGFHKIESIVNRVSLFDELIISLRGDPIIQIFCSDKSLENENNLCVKAVNILKRRFKIRYGFSLHLKKNIPVGAGLGGGSSCAASTILGIAQLLNLNLSQQLLYKLGSKLGSDVNFFLSQSSWALLTGRGQKVKPLDLKVKFKYLIVYPKRALSTKLVYQHTKVKLTKFFNNVKIVLYALKNIDYALLQQVCFNVLEKGAFSLSGFLSEKRSLLKKMGFKMTGSGGAFFTFLTNQKQAKVLRRVFSRDWAVYEADAL